ncbi:p7 [Raspberry leaf mottle virus]|uniref:p7 n=1 Tax=Raspberry leaf mottle virus TaxID=326941 RepID=A0MBW5_9CLOS|nr:p7 [Raspberry leaf mottle virus]ABC87276.1 p7 [Raspberry leaf mottle virus]QRG29093.1 p7 [Raspberry leaf mottle virus]
MPITESETPFSLAASPSSPPLRSTRVPKSSILAFSLLLMLTLCLISAFFISCFRFHRFCRL